MSVVDRTQAGSDPCQHHRNDGRELAPDGGLRCGRCKAEIPYPRATNQCGHHGAHFPLEAGQAKCAECGTVFRLRKRPT